MLKRIALAGLFVVGAALLTVKPVAADQGAKLTTGKAPIVKPIVGQGLCPAGMRC